MNYEKPELVSARPACAAIQSGAKPMGNPDSDHQPSVGAYEADE